MKNFVFLSLIMIQIITHHGLFAHQRKMPPHKQPGEVGMTIRRPARKGKKLK